MDHSYRLFSSYAYFMWSFCIALINIWMRIIFFSWTIQYCMVTILKLIRWIVQRIVMWKDNIFHIMSKYWWTDGIRIMHNIGFQSWFCYPMRTGYFWLYEQYENDSKLSAHFKWQCRNARMVCLVAFWHCKKSGSNTSPWIELNKVVMHNEFSPTVNITCKLWMREELTLRIKRNSLFYKFP